MIKGSALEVIQLGGWEAHTEMVSREVELRSKNVWVFWVHKLIHDMSLQKMAKCKGL